MVPSGRTANHASGLTKTACSPTGIVYGLSRPTPPMRTSSGSGWLNPDRRTYANRQPKVVTQSVIQPARPIGRDQTVIRGAAARETRKMERATRSAVSAAAFLQALDACAAHFTEARIAEPRAFGLLAPAPPWCEPRSSPAPSRRARHRCARGSTICCLGIEAVAASPNSSRQTLARKG